MHDGIFFGRLHFSVQKSDRQIGEDLLGKRFGVSHSGFHRRTVILYSLTAKSFTIILCFIDRGANDIDLMSLLHLFADKAVEPFAVGFIYGKG